jgi:flagellar protein FlaG
MDIRSLGSGVQVGAAQIQAAPLATSQAAADPAPTPVSAAPVSQPNQTAGTSLAQAEPSASKVQEAVQKINSSSAVQSQGIEFTIDATSHRIVVKVVDQSNNQVIRQIPSKEALAIADSLDESQGGQSSQGLLIKQQA